MNNLNDVRLKIAVFIDFDNIAIGVKQSLNRNFDIGTVLEAIKEKGEVITKIAYGDWKRAEDYSRAMTQHAVQMVQRNLTPGGDKNGADIALALDALETAFTRSHINTFVIVGGDSDFIALVEKLKQYDKTVFVVGGRAFTSIILQKNCHEFISYENLVGINPGSRRSTGKSPVSGSSSLEQALPLVRRALKILSDREVSPQLGLLKSTLLQLDSTFSERDYGVGSFRDFIQKLADAGHVHLKQVDRSLLVELKETERAVKSEIPEPPAATAEPPAETTPPDEQPAPALPASDAIRVLEELLRDGKVKPYWPMYLRTFKQMIRSLQPPFDERAYGLSSTYDLARQAHKDGLFRVERNRQGILRIYPGERFQRTVTEPTAEGKAPVESSIAESAIKKPAPDGTGRETTVSDSETILQAGIPAIDIPPAPSSEPAVEIKDSSPVEPVSGPSPESPAEPWPQEAVADGPSEKQESIGKLQEKKTKPKTGRKTGSGPGSGPETKTEKNKEAGKTKSARTKTMRKTAKTAATEDIPQ
ncbi:MAG TPA: NYN domain-containing protein [Acidobacteriota bacterium]|nr:NYN domain-containing protein [Acidobacteriota bacterium]